MDWLSAIESLAIGVFATLLTILIVFLFFRPDIELDKEVRARPNDPPPTQSQIERLKGTVAYASNVRQSEVEQDAKYLLRYRNNGRVDLFDLRIKVWLRVDIGLVDGDRKWRLVPVPTLGEARPSLPAKNKKVTVKWQTPRLLLEQINWPQHLPPEKWPNRPLDLKAILEELNAELYFHVTGTTVGFQVTRVNQRIYGSGDVESSRSEPSVEDSSALSVG